jgi:hypothetical protein
MASDKAEAWIQAGAFRENEFPRASDVFESVTGAQCRSRPTLGAREARREDAGEAGAGAARGGLGDRSQIRKRLGIRFPSSRLVGVRGIEISEKIAPAMPVQRGVLCVHR